MTDNDETAAGRWAARARAAAQQRQAQPWPPAPEHRPAPEAAPQQQTPPAESKPRRGKPTPAAASEARPAAGSAASSAVNPFLPGTRKTVIDDEERHEEGGEGLAALGFGHAVGPTSPPVAPAPLNPAVRVPSGWPGAPAPAGTCVQLVGLHGGAGVSTLAGLLGEEAIDCGPGLGNLVTLQLPVLFVTRSHAHGLDLALRVGQQHASRTLEPLMILGLVVVHDAPTLSKGLARTLRSVEKSLPNCWTVPWSEDLRHDTAPPPAATGGRTGRDAHRILKKASQLRDSREPPSGLLTIN